MDKRQILLGFQGRGSICLEKLACKNHRKLSATAACRKLTPKLKDSIWVENPLAGMLKALPTIRRILKVNTKKRASKPHLDGLLNIASDFAGDLAYHMLLEAEIGGVETGRASDVGSLYLRIEANLVRL